MPSAPPDYSDRMVYITPDGVEYKLSAPLFVIQEDGFGMPPIDYVTERGPFQHGETVKDYFMRPRTIQLIVRRNGCTRSEYWNIRKVLLDILRPGRGLIQSPPAPGLLRKYLANGDVRELFVYTSQGPGFASHSPDQWDQWSVQDTIRFTAYDPVMRDPVLQSKSYASSGTSGTFPITFPWLFASFGIGAQDITYSGTFLAFPTITINGPVVSPLIRNVTTGEKIQFTFTLAGGEQAVADLSYGHKTVTKNDGTNLIGFVTADSDVATFHLNPGLNQMQITATGTSAISSFVVSWYNRYVGF